MGLWSPALDGGLEPRAWESARPGSYQTCGPSGRVPGAEDRGYLLGAHAVQVQVNLARRFERRAPRRGERLAAAAGHLTVACRAPGCRPVW